MNPTQSIWVQPHRSYVGLFQFGLRFYPTHKQGYLMVLLGDEAQVETHFGLFGDNANLDAR
jgi:hypothetical protein